MYQIIIQEVTPRPGVKPRVVECYRQEFEQLNVLELVAKINAPARSERATRSSKQPAAAAQATPAGSLV